jgi:Rrf2 family protein
MKLQYTTDCAIRMLVYLMEKNRIVSSNELERELGFPQQSVFSVGRKLKKAGFINTVAGPFGGYTLGKAPEDISIQEILCVFQDGFILYNQPKKPAATTVLRHLDKWMMKVESDTIKKMASYTLADLMKDVGDH